MLQRISIIPTNSCTNIKTYANLKYINKLYLNIVWTQKSNYLSIPTDCPQRDERF
ncbi:MAG: hypothetical protein PUD04_10375, partial [Firmicutes bacterium]|nr:hypothetical protein [Bacillota bacterium]